MVRKSLRGRVQICPPSLARSDDAADVCGSGCGCGCKQWMGVAAYNSNSLCAHCSVIVFVSRCVYLLKRTTLASCQPARPPLPRGHLPPPQCESETPVNYSLLTRYVSSVIKINGASAMSRHTRTRLRPPIELSSVQTILGLVRVSAS